MSEEKEGKKKVANRGDVAEGILATAIATRFIKGKPQVTTQDLVAVLSQINKKKDVAPSQKQVAKSISKSLKRPDGTVDNITLDIRLAAVNFNDLMDINKRWSVADLFASAVEYVNSPFLINESTQIILDGMDTKIVVLSDGVGDQKGTKVDVRVFKDGKELGIGKISLKAGGTKQLGQIGKSWSADEKKKSRGIFDLFKGLFGIEIDSRLKVPYLNAIMSNNKANIAMAVDEVYQNAYKKLHEIYKRNNDKEIKDFLSNLARAVKYEAVLDEEGVILVHLDKGHFEALDFSKIKDKFVGLRGNMEVNYTPLTNPQSTVPYLYFSIQGGKRLISIRPKIRDSGEFRHYVQKEQGLIDILKMKKGEESSQEKKEKETTEQKHTVRKLVRECLKNIQS